MVRRALRSRSLRRVKVKTPGGRVVTHFRKRKPKLGHCAETGEALKGVARARPSQLAKVPRSARRPERPYGGMLSSKAMRRTLKGKARRMDS